MSCSLRLDIGFVIAIAIACFVSSVASAIVHVSPEGDNTDGTSWEKAFHSIPDAITSAETMGTDVWIAEGTYPVSTALTLPEGTHLFGGFPTTGNPSLAERNTHEHVTTLDGENVAGNLLVADGIKNIQIDGLVLTRAAGTRAGYGSAGAIACNNSAEITVNDCVFLDNYNTYGAGINIFQATAMVSNSRFERGDSHEGGGIKCHSGTIHLSDCIFTNNNASQIGGGVSAYASVMTVTRCIFTSNSSRYGGGLECHEGSATTITDCLFKDNVSAYDGGGFRTDWNEAILERCTFLNNTASAAGGGIKGHRSSLRVVRCTFLNNSASGGGAVDNSDNHGTHIENSLLVGNHSQNLSGAVSYVDRYNKPQKIINCTIARNGGLHGGGVYAKGGQLTIANTILSLNAGHAIYQDDTNEPVALDNCLFHENELAYTNNGGLSAQTGSGEIGLNTLLATAHDNVDADPRFVSPVGYDFRLQSASPCIDNGKLDLAPEFDLMGFARPQGPGTDLGAYEYPVAATDSDGDGIPNVYESTADSDGDGTADFLDTDSDDDTLSDQVEGFGDRDADGLINSLDLDSDGDTIPDSTEGSGDADNDGTPNYLDSDSDADGLPDAIESANGLNPLNAEDASEDTDEDSLSNADEVMIYKTKPLISDTDADSIPDGLEVANSLDPLAPTDASQDADADTLSNADEILIHHTDIRKSDTDNDNMSDAWETANELDPLADDSQADPDIDTFTNLEEFTLHTNPLDPSSPPSEVYVSLDGDDSSGDGTAEDSWATIGTAMNTVGYYAKSSHPVTIHVAAGTYSEQVYFAPYVTLSGADEDLTKIEYYNVEDDKHVVVVGAEKARLENCTVAAVQGIPDAIILVRIENAAMGLCRVSLDGGLSPFTIGVEVTGIASSSGSIQDCWIGNLYDGIWANDSGILLARNKFESIARHAVFVLEPEMQGNDFAVPTLGRYDQFMTSGLNRFRNIGQKCIYNASHVTVIAETNDWGAYSTEEVTAKISGDVAIEYFLSSGIEDNSLVVRLLDTETGNNILESATAAIQAESFGLTGFRDTNSSLFILQPIENSSYSVTASAVGYETKTIDIQSSMNRVQPFVINLQPSISMEGQAEGVVPAEGEVEGQGEGEPPAEGQAEGQNEGQPPTEGQAEGQNEGESSDGENIEQTEGEHAMEDETESPTSSTIGCFA